MRLLKSKNIIRKKNEVALLLKKGKILYTEHLKIFYLNNELNSMRFFVSASKKWGKSNKRNRFKRLVKEAIRELYQKTEFSIDLAIFPNRNLPSRDCKNIKSYFIKKQIMDGLNSLQIKKLRG
ncbi:MAG: ribonuclease P protein component [Leptonema sp. (in: bacteria)]